MRQGLGDVFDFHLERRLAWPVAVWEFDRGIPLPLRHDESRYAAIGPFVLALES